MVKLLLLLVVFLLLLLLVVLLLLLFLHVVLLLLLLLLLLLHLLVGSGSGVVEQRCGTCRHVAMVSVHMVKVHDLRRVGIVVETTMELHLFMK